MKANEIKTALFFKLEQLNTAEAMGKGNTIKHQARNGYYAVDFYNGTTCIKTLRAGLSLQECYIFICGIYAATLDAPTFRQ